MDLEKLVNQAVIHKSFGKGIIVSVDEKYLNVNFAPNEKVTKFFYPSCFNDFLTLEDCALQTEISCIVGVWKQESGAVKKEELMHGYEKTMQGIESRRIAAEEKN